MRDRIGYRRMFAALLVCAGALPLHAVGASKLFRPGSDRAPRITNEPAEVVMLNTYEADTFKKGVKLFLERPFVLKEAPEWLLGRDFTRSSIYGLNFRSLRVQDDSRWKMRG